VKDEALCGNITYSETQKKIKALKDFLTKHKMNVKNIEEKVSTCKPVLVATVSGVNSCANEGTSCHEVLSTKNDMVHLKDIDLQQQCDRIQEMMATYISSLKSAKEMLQPVERQGSTSLMKSNEFFVQVSAEWPPKKEEPALMEEWPKKQPSKRAMNMVMVKSSEFRSEHGS